MIKSFAHKGLRQFFETGSNAGIQPAHAERLRLILTLLNSAVAPEDLALPGLNFHRLVADLNGFWSVKISGNYRIIFKFEDRNVFEVDYLDYQ